MRRLVHSSSRRCAFPLEKAGALSLGAKLAGRPILRGVLVLALAACALGFAGPVRADDELAALVGQVEWVEQPGARFLAVHDSLNLLVTGFDTGKDAFISVRSLDRRGRLNDDEEPVEYELPKAPEFDEFHSYPLAAVFHPELPLLYVWQDIESDAPGDEVRASFDHLVVLEVGEGKIEQKGAYARGVDFAHGQGRAALAFGNEGRRLFIPNLRGPDGERHRGAVGYFDLDEAGAIRPVRVIADGDSDAQGIGLVEERIQPTWIFTAPRSGPADGLSARRVLELPTGSGFFSPGGRSLLLGANSGLAVWDTEDRRQALSEIMLEGWSQTELAGRPDEIPLFYAAERSGNKPRVLWMRHAGGFPTLLPDWIEVPGAGFRTPPVVMTGTPQGLAIGGDEQLQLLLLDDEGRPTGEVEVFQVPGEGNVTAIGYSPRHEKLYVGVEEAARAAALQRANRMLYQEWDFLPGIDAAPALLPAPTMIGSTLRFVEDGPAGVAIEVERTEDSFAYDGLRFPSHSLLSPEEGVAVEIWFKPAQEFGMLIDKMRQDHRAQDYKMDLTRGDDGQVLRVTLGFGGEDNIERLVSGPVEATEGQWHHAAFSYDGGGRLRIFFNGEIVAEETFPNRGPLSAGNQGFSIGDITGATYRGFESRIGRVRVHHEDVDFSQISLDD